MSQAQNDPKATDFLAEHVTDASKEEAIVLIIPVGVQPPQDFPFPVTRFSDAKQSLQDYVAAILGHDVVVIEVEPDFVNSIINIARYVDVELRVLVGFAGEYPSYWNATTASIPVAITSEIMVARGESEVVGGPGIPVAKQEKEPFKDADLDAVARRLSVLAKVGAAKQAPAGDKVKTVAKEGEESDAMDE